MAIIVIGTITFTRDFLFEHDKTNIRNTEGTQWFRADLTGAKS